MKKSKKSKKPKGPVVHEGEAEFVFPNGDKYVGSYCAHVSGIVWRQGRGIYFTHDGQTYEGEWKDDKLREQVNLEIVYQNGDRYIGKISKYKYNGPGAYLFANGAKLIGNFHNNKPSGDVVFADHHGNVWEGRAELVKDQVLLFKEHVFSSELDENRGKGIPKFRERKKKPTITVDRDENVKQVDMKELEKQIFAKTKKIRDNIDLEEPKEWFTEFKKYEEMYKSVLPKITSIASLTHLDENEREWLLKYLDSMDILERHKNKILPDISCDLLKQFYSDEFRNSCPPVRVFYPSSIDDEEEEEELEQ